ncbi:MAG: hypothetical protein UT07_C0004G0018 [Parcubacteria group bacterium GW2011_GWB1_38_8]|uniref:Uncharacterized protein n=1 Tax=Candidatus Zambryskibacteria bacterium RIFCSPLOWO2_02_FULL_39_14 TaxID=1802769 RepID=A0A1G2UHS7_9BACT|nr:MAG: hypothetical protein UT07_C0004G0018 [Parcubacteria group bacterium GW2011_GWB1_38_8]KKR30957.1 MAG: hypothetical protein UT62_C0003G0012 [Parcubacteria group bacterium GW2011_GWC1_39_8]OHA95458.1 MAG: hypothetical protein A3C62_00420 [Candidatus Zambryskibacteria bacterium RIFCSPHIGHO2_02_FULL_39_16]OHB08986.1 MAG: hypothetical protein A3I86_01275 [Candidatus Zambryskibacteria bacterium RIFCSPLOWO2_02_FULL_39_14]
MEPEQQQNNVNVETESKNSNGPIIGVVIILVIIILGGFYFWSQRTDNIMIEDDSMMTDKALESIKMQSESDDTASIEADLDSTDVETLDSQINAS